MKKYSTVILFFIIILGFNNPCLANPLSNIMALFQRDLVIDLLYKNHRNLFSKNANAYIVAISSLEASDKTPLKSGSLVKGITFLEYKIGAAGKELKKVMDNIKKQNNEVVSQLEEYIDTFDTEAFHKKIDRFFPVGLNHAGNRQ